MFVVLNVFPSACNVAAVGVMVSFSLCSVSAAGGAAKRQQPGTAYHQHALA